MSEFRTVAVAGSGSGCGKTTVACRILSVLAGYVGIKASPGGMYCSVTDAPEVINEPGKDTALMVEAGAANAILVSCPPDEMSGAVSQAMVLAGNAPGAVVEGNSACMSLESPDLFVFVLGPAPYGLKPGSEDALAKADVVIVNEPGGDVNEEAMQLVRKYNGRASVVTAGAPLDTVLSSLASSN